MATKLWCKIDMNNLQECYGYEDLLTLLEVQGLDVSAAMLIGIETKMRIMHAVTNMMQLEDLEHSIQTVCRLLPLNDKEYRIVYDQDTQVWEFIWNVEVPGANHKEKNSRAYEKYKKLQKRTKDNTVDLIINGGRHSGKTTIRKMMEEMVASNPPYNPERTYMGKEMENDSCKDCVYRERIYDMLLSQEHRYEAKIAILQEKLERSQVLAYLLGSIVFAGLVGLVYFHIVELLRIGVLCGP